MARTNSYTELETGMHWLKDGQWQEAGAEITLANDGAEATNCAHQVSFSSNLNATNAVELMTPDGQHMRSRIVGLGYYDSASGQFVLFARLQDSFGLLYPPDRAVYPDAFDALEADVEYINAKAGLEQNIILRAQPPSPTKWNLNPETTRLQVLTEFFDPPSPQKPRSARAAPDGDETLVFGKMQMGRGRAFLVANGSADRQAILVAKRWLKTEVGRTFLVEEVKFSPLNAGVQSLPASQRTAWMVPSQIGRGETLLAALQQAVPKESSKPKSGVMRLAKADAVEHPGFVMDYSVLSSTSDFTFKADTTYYCTNSVNLSGTTTFEGGTVVKFATNTSASINLSGTIECRTGPYRPAIATTRDDDTVGEVVFGSTSNPQKASSGGWLSISSSDNTLAYFRIAHASSAVRCGFSSGQLHLADMQFVDCRYAVEFTGFGGSSDDTVFVDNCLFYGTTNVFKGGVDNFVRGQHLTVNQCNKFWVHSGGSNGELYLTNSLLVDITSGLGSLDVKVQDHSPLVTGAAGVFQTVGAGAHYLVDGSTNRNTGTTNISASLLAEIRRQTTYPPIVSSLQISGADVQLYPQAQRDTDTPDIGYHYDPLDYAFATLRITNSTMTVMPGTAIGTFCGGYSYGLALQTGAKFHAEGLATEPIWIARYNTVQEQANLNWTNLPSGSDFSIIGNWVGGTEAEIRCHFTKFSALANRSTHFSDYSYAMSMWFSDCEFHGGNFSVSQSSLNVTNCLFDRAHSYLADDSWANDVKVRNCTFYGGDFTVAHWDSGEFLFRNNLFAAITNHQDGDIDSDYNGYTTGTTVFTVNGLSNIVASLVFVAGPLGYFYQPSSSAFIDNGSTTADAFGLYHYATTTNLVSGLQVKETTSTVDMGYHYVALNSNNLPIDTDGDGIPDYEEDVNGDGSTSGDPTAWTPTYNSPNGLASGSGLRVFTPLK